MIRTCLVACALLVGCDQEVGFPGVTGVGNPGSSSQRISAGEDVAINSASVFTEALLVDQCDEVIRVEVGAEVDLLAGASLEVPGGEWCGLSVVWSGPVVVEGADIEDPTSTFTLSLDAGGTTVDTTSRFAIDGDAMILQLGQEGWVDRADLGLEDGSHTQIQAGDSSHDALARALEMESALWLDADGSGEIEDAEAQSSPLASGADFEDDDDDEST